jgi:hypothetical protein
MKGWLRRLRGGVAGVMLAVDVDSPRERERLRALKIGSIASRMPPTAPLSAPAQRTLVRAARGRPGWLLRCVELASDSRYWDDERLKTGTLVLDTEMRLRAVGV